MDETYVNAKKDDDKNDNDKGGQGRSTKTKTPIIAFKEKNGNFHFLTKKYLENYVTEFENKRSAVSQIKLKNKYLFAISL